MKSVNYILKTIILFFIIVNLFTSCETESIPVDLLDANGLRKEAKKVTVYKEEIAQYIKDGVINQDSILTFSNNTPKIFIPKVGDIIFIPITEKTPYGFFAKVNSIQTNSNIQIKTETALLTDVCKAQSIDTMFSITNKLISCSDGNGNSLKYEFVSNQTSSGSKSQRAGGYGENMYSLKLKIPINDESKDSKDKYMSINGALTMSLDSIHFKLDINNFKLNKFNFNISPGLKLELCSKFSFSTKLDSSKLIGKLNFAPIEIPTPIGVPIIIHPQIYLYLVYGAKGEVSVTSTFQYQYSSNYGLNFQNNQWSYIAKNGDFSNKSPFSVNEFEMNGESYLGDKIGFFCGFYSADTGFGISYIPKFVFNSSFKFNMNDLILSNPEINIKATQQGDLYFKAALFGKEIAHYSIYTPEYISWSEKFFLMPKITSFTAVGDGVSSATINYQIDSNYLLGFLGTVNHGFVVYDSFGNIVKSVNSPSNVEPNNMGVYTYTVQVPNLDATKVYYAAPFVSFISNTSSNYLWYGKKVTFGVDPVKINMLSYNLISTSYLLNGYTGADGKLYSYYWKFDLKATIQNSKNVSEWGICVLKKYNWTKDVYYPLKLKDGEGILSYSMVSNYYPWNAIFSAYAKLRDGSIVYSDPITVTYSYTSQSNINKKNNIIRKINCINVPN